MTNATQIAAPDLGKLSVAQLRALGKQILVAKTAAIEVEKQNKPVKERGTGILAAVMRVVFTDPTLKGEKLLVEVNKHAKTTQGVCDSCRGDLLRNGRFLKGKTAAELAVFFGKLPA